MSASVTSSVQAQADRWLARQRAPGLAQAERAEFQRWLQARPEHAHAYAAADALWNELAALQQDEEIAALGRAAERPGVAAARPGAGRPWWLGIAAAACLAALALAGGAWLLKPVLFPSQGALPHATYATAIGERRSITLEDGSVVTLNTDSEITARYLRGRRQLSLHRGEAEFVVRHDGRRPFVVDAAADTQGGRITALGTRFQVRRVADAVTVTLLEGSVAVARGKADEVILQPGELAEYRALVPGIARRAADLDSATAWTEGRLSFHQTPLPQAVAEVNRYTARKLELDPALASLNISGSFGTDAPDAFLAALEAMFSLRAVPEDGGARLRLVRDTQ